MCWSAVVGWDTCYAPQKPKALRCSHIWVDPAHMSYRGISPPRTDVTKKFISIYGHDDALVAVWLMVKQMPRIPTTELPNMVPRDAIWFISFRHPERNRVNIFYKRLFQRIRQINYKYELETSVEGWHEIYKMLLCITTDTMPELWMENLLHLFRNCNFVQDGWFAVTETLI